MGLAEKKCVPCQGGIPPLTPGEIKPLLDQLESWEVEEGKKLKKTFKFKNFVEAMEFAKAITPVAEEEGHHPDLLVSYGKVTVYLWTHKIDGLTESDFFMAAKIDLVKSNLSF
ncbi:4a-hydroxytetrahydrobiopterin dehydratase [Bdellovibrionota bacterium]